MEFHRGTWLPHGLRITGLALGLSLPGMAGAADLQSMDVQAPALVAPGLGCGAASATAALFVRVSAARPHRHARPPRRHHADAAPPPPADAGRQPPAEAPPRLSHAYFTCTTTPLTAIPMGAGWLAVGPIRRV